MSIQVCYFGDERLHIDEYDDNKHPAHLAAEGPLPLDSKVEAGQSVATKLVFDIPASAAHPAFALGSELKLNPASIVIADEGHFLHKPTIVPLD